MMRNMGEQQTIWGWKIAAYLFLAGVGAGAHVVGVSAEFAGEGWRFFAQAGITLGAPLVALSTIFLIVDLGRPFYFFRAGYRPQTSWISRGVFILGAFMLVGFLHLLLWVAFPVLDDAEVARKAIGVVGGVLGIMTMVYTGLLLGAVRPVPFWSTPILPLLFLVSALSTGIMAVALVAAVGVMIVDDIEVAREATLLASDSGLLALEALVVLAYLYLMRNLPAAKASSDALLIGSLAALFWLGFVALGLLVPLAFELLLVDAWADRGAGAHLTITLAGVIPGLAGGFILRLLVVTGGFKGPLIVIGRTAVIPARLRLLP